jgi:hypothetical protein
MALHSFGSLGEPKLEILGKQCGFCQNQGGIHEAICKRMWHVVPATLLQWNGKIRASCFE